MSSDLDFVEECSQCQIVFELDDEISSTADELTKADLTHRYLWGPGRNHLLVDEAIASRPIRAE